MATFTKGQRVRVLDVADGELATVYRVNHTNGWTTTYEVIYDHTPGDAAMGGTYYADELEAL